VPAVHDRGHPQTEARRLASDLEREAERQFLGLEPSLDDESITFGEWPAAAGRRRNFVSRVGYLHSRGTFRKHLVDSSLANVRVADLTTGKILRLPDGEIRGPCTTDGQFTFVLLPFGR